jgi:hypothetical protein
MRIMQYRKKVNTRIMLIFLTLAMILAIVPTASAACATTLTPTSQAPGGSVSVAGTGFGAAKAVGIGLGTEVVVTGEAHSLTNVTIGGPDVYGPFTAKTNHYPIKPGSLSFHCVVSSDTNVVESDYTDNGDGTLASSSTYALDPFVNYVTGVFGRSSTSDWSAYTVVYTASYTYYQYNVTPAAGVTTSASGAFSAPITVPSACANGNHNVTAVDTSGNRASATLGVSSSIPEVFPVGVMVLLSSVGLIVGSRYFRKQSRTESGHSVKLPK